MRLSSLISDFLGWQVIELREKSKLRARLQNAAGGMGGGGGGEE